MAPKPEPWSVSGGEIQESLKLPFFCELPAFLLSKNCMNGHHTEISWIEVLPQAPPPPLAAPLTATAASAALVLVSAAAFCLL